MCGIVGCINLGAEAFNWNRDQKYFGKMLALQKHRGPDDQGLRGFQYEDDINEALEMEKGFSSKLDGMVGFNRLMIQDLSINGHQPMIDRKKSIILAFNGEIYNAEEYRKVLIENGCKFQGHSDTEVIMHLYLYYGISVFEKLNGMFAISIVDLRKREVYLVRDRFGIKPMYYCIIEGHLYWASEYKSFLEIPQFQRKFNNTILNEYIIFQSSPNKTLLQGVEQLKPGEILTIHGHNIKKEFYYNIDTLVRENNDSSLEKNIENLDKELQKAVSRQMISDVKVGCQLSGGVDSSLVSYYASKNLHEMKDSVSIIFHDSAMNEEKYIDKAAEDLSLISHKYVLNRDYLIQNLKKVIWHLEALPTHPNTIALMLLTQEAKKNVTVLLSGEGADEVFGGYPEFAKQYLVENYLKHREIQNLLKTSYQRRDWFYGMQENSATYTVVSDMIVFPKEVAQLLGIEDVECIKERCQLLNNFTGTSFDKLIKYKLTTYLPEILTRQDKMSMANSIENRVPLLDNEIVDFSFKLPYNHLICLDSKKLNRLQDLKILEENITGKYILKRICENKFGRDFAFRPKGGFGMPMKYYFSSSIFEAFFNENILEPMKKRNTIDASYVNRLYKRLPVLDWRELELLWKAICIEMYQQVYIDSKTG